ncbi:MAG: hypothetical protein Q9211_001476 [Gyalolechia sp. 1 TL-2023]
MSRNDIYLSLCLEQASLSSLHYRHGCIIVQGGKVIGKGYNDYRPGFDGGVRNNGRLSSAGTFGEPDTSKPKPKKPTGTGGGPLANTPLSMHSEMMAISSALSLSAAIACQGTARSAQWLQKPCFKLPSRSKRQSRSRQLNAYADTLYQAKLYYDAEEEEKKEKAHKSMRQNTGNNNVHHHTRINSLRFHPMDPQKVRQSPNDDNNNENEKHRRSDGGQNRHPNRHKEGQGLTRQNSQQQRQGHEPTALVLPQHRIITKSYHTAERMKVPRLNGADLYVARLARAGRTDHFDCGCERAKSAGTEETMGDDRFIEQQSADLAEPSQPNPSTSSLHDELLFPSPSEERKPTLQSVSKSQPVTATQSRPCYRCIAYMHSAGIKRVFWTNNKGGWEGGKVRDLVDALEGPVSRNSYGSMDASGAASVYVTKSEVLLLKGLK